MKFIYIFFTCLSMSVFGQDTIYPSKVALLIGNDKYSSIDPLSSTEDEATLVAETLYNLGFDTIVCLSATMEQLNFSISRFIDKMENGGVALFYYSGHGLQYQSESYIVPVDFILAEPENISTNCISVNDVLEKMGTKKSHLNLLIIDACRNELPKAIGSTGGTISIYNENQQIGGHSLSNIALRNTNNTIVAFATHAGLFSYESQYTPKFVECVQERNTSVFEIFNCIHSRFNHGTQKPMIAYASYGGSFCFSGSADGFNPLNILCLEISEDKFEQKSKLFERTLKSELSKENYNFFVDKELAEYTLFIDVKSLNGGGYQGRTFTAFTDVYIEIKDKNGNILKSFQIEDGDREKTKQISTRNFEDAADKSYKKAASIVADKIIKILN